MELGDAIARYGYPAVFFGTMLEGETVLVLAGFAAHRGHLDLSVVIACAFFGTLLSDQLYFYLGRRHGAAWLARRPGWRERVNRVRGVVQRNQTKLTLSFRFMYGIRTVVPFALGLSDVSRARFTALNATSAALWAAAFGALGWALGQALEQALGKLERYELELFLGLALVGLAWSLLRRRRKASAAKAT